MRLKSIFTAFIILTFFVSGYSISIEKLNEAKALIKKGVDNWNEKTLKEARDLLLNLILKEKGNPYLFYYLALADYRLTTFYIGRDSKKTEIYLKEGKEYLKKAMELEPKEGEFYALYASLLGMEIGLTPQDAMSLGMESERYFFKAFDKAKDNPRVNLLYGVSLLYTPKEFGGGAKRASKYLLKSIALFEKEKIEDPIKPSWGFEEAYTYLGIVWYEMDEKEKAKEAFEKTLGINPSFGCAKMWLKRLEADKKRLDEK